MVPFFIVLSACSEPLIDLVIHDGLLASARLGNAPADLTQLAFMKSSTAKPEL
jgi:hypothetical protein